MNQRSIADLMSVLSIESRTIHCDALLPDGRQKAFEQLSPMSKMRQRLDGARFPSITDAAAPAVAELRAVVSCPLGRRLDMFN